MKKIKSIFAAVLVCLSASAFAQYTINDIKSSFNDFSDILNKTLPNAAVQQNVYADAWIGNLIPSIPPHFAVGVEFGVAKLNLDPLEEICKVFDISGVPNGFVFPLVSANARVGGFILPFDAGISFMTIDTRKITPIEGFGIKYFNLGGDVRWAILKGEGTKPKVSVGAGFYYTSGRVSYEHEDFDAALEYKIKTAFLQAQISKRIIFFTPYAGFRAIFSNSKTDWKWQVTDELATKAASFSFINADDLRASGSRSTSFGSDFIPQVYGGFGLNFGVIGLNFCASWDFRNALWGADFSLRFQL